VISLTHVAQLRGISATRIGAGARLVELEESAQLRTAFPVIAATVAQIATPLICQTGTVGGNLLVDTRCFWFNQTPDFRVALGSCLKAETHECRVMPNTSVCYAAYSGDLGPVLMVLQARLELAGARGVRTISVHDFFVPPAGDGNGAHRMPDGARLDGIGRNTKRPDEVIVAVELPAASQGLRAGYMKLRARDSIDFPDAGMAVALRTDAAGRITELHLVATAVAPTPLLLDELGAGLVGTKPDEATIRALGDRVTAEVVPHKNAHFTPKYRSKMLGVFTRRLLQQLLG
jgi:4-hydroxybenzoyl-CoA reductase subunit beta